MFSRAGFSCVASKSLKRDAFQQDEPKQKKKAVTAPWGIMIPGLILLFGNASMDHIKLITPISLFLRYHCGHERYYSAMR